MHVIQTVAQWSSESARSLRVRSALNPVLWLCAIASPACFIAAYAFRDFAELRTVLVGFGVLPVLVACLGFVYFAIAKPERLQSEDYQLRTQALQLLQKGRGRKALDPATLQAIANPALPALPASTHEVE